MRSLAELQEAMAEAKMRGETHIDCTPAERDLIVAETCWQMIPHAAFRRTP